jgi:hypothetical protein
MLKNPDYGIYATVAAGAFLTLQKSQMMKDAGAGMIGAMAADLGAALGVSESLTGPTRLMGPGRRRTMNLTPGQQADMVKSANRAAARARGGMGSNSNPDVSAYAQAIETAN